MRRKIAILGSTGSIGKNALKVASHLKDKIEIVVLAANSNIDLLEQQAIQHQPKLIAVYDRQKAFALQKKLPHIKVVAGLEGLCEAATYPEVHTVLTAFVGAIGLIPTAEAIKAKKAIALANKETLVAAGGYIMPLAKQYNVPLIPVDSEHSAVFQCIHGEKGVRRIILTSSGGPFRELSQDKLQQVTIEDALKHPNFAMGPKITIDSSTMMNKGLEVIEAYWLFGVDLNAIEVLIHPQQKIHSMVEFIDGSILAQLCEPDMLIPIQYGMTYPERCGGILPPYDFIKNSRLDFAQPDMKKFSCLAMAYEAIKVGGTMPCYLNAANEVLVSRFLNREISWQEIARKLQEIISKHSASQELTLDNIIATDQLARETAQQA